MPGSICAEVNVAKRRRARAAKKVCMRTSLLLGRMTGEGGCRIFGGIQRRVNTEATEQERRGHKEDTKQRIEKFHRKSPPFANRAKDGAPSRSFVGWR